jgi:hypothetical protein
MKTEAICSSKMSVDFFSTKWHYISDKKIFHTDCCENLSSNNNNNNNNNNNYSMVLVRERTILTEWPPLVSEVSANFCGDGCYVVSSADPYGRNLGFLDRSRYFFFQLALQLYSRGWVDPIPDPLLLIESGSAGNRTRTSGSVARNPDY